MVQWSSLIAYGPGWLDGPLMIGYGERWLVEPCNHPMIACGWIVSDLGSMLSLVQPGGNASGYFPTCSRIPESYKPHTPEHLPESGSRMALYGAVGGGRCGHPTRRLGRQKT